MTGYQEVVTDPSFAEQIVCFTAPMVGNYGVDPALGPAGCTREAPSCARRGARRGRTGSTARHSGTDGIDTRSLVLRLHEVGAMRAAIVSGERRWRPCAQFASSRRWPGVPWLPVGFL